MAASFKLPSLATKRKPPLQFPEFEWRDVRIKEELGSGTFGCVYLVKYGKEDQNVIVKKMKGESTETKQHFQKEAGILNSVRVTKSSEFLRFCQKPYTIMMEYSCFDFNFLGLDKIMCSFEDFIHFVDAEFKFTSFSDVLLLCARDVVTGIEFLNQKNIAHRDPKPGNTLVSNQHYSSRDRDGDWAELYAKCPIVCKLADFGLSRSS